VSNAEAPASANPMRIILVSSESRKEAVGEERHSQH